MSKFFVPSNRIWQGLKYFGVQTAIFDALYMALAPTLQITQSKFFLHALSRSGAQSMKCFIYVCVCLTGVENKGVQLIINNSITMGNESREPIN